MIYCSRLPSLRKICGRDTTLAARCGRMTAKGPMLTKGRWLQLESVANASCPMKPDLHNAQAMDKCP